MTWLPTNTEPPVTSVRATRPATTIVRDVVRMCDLNRVLDEAPELTQYAGLVVVVPRGQAL